MFHVQFKTINPITGKEYNPCGSEYGSIIHDLKTTKGVIKRISQWNKPKNTIAIEIYHCCGLSDDGRLVYRQELK